MLYLNKILVLPETIQEIIDFARENDKEIYKGGMTEHDFLKDCCYIQDGPTVIKVYTIHDGKAGIFYTYKDGRDIYPGVPEGLNCYRIMARHYWKPEKEYEPCGLSASPLLGYNPKYNGTRQKAYSYDLNSAYSAVMMNGWIDTTNPPEAKIVEEGEVGFSADLSTIVDVGDFSFFVFKKIETPEGIKRFINTYYERKKNAKTKADKIYAKNMLNHIVGCLQKKNYFLRAYVVANCNRFIQDLIDEDTLYYNTDCIVSRCRRPDLEENLGDGIGQWKLDHEGEFAYQGFTYQWDYEKPAWRSVPKAWIPEHYDILDCEDVKIVETNVWYMDWQNIRFVKKEGLV
jgi:hypothetical protein